MNRINNTGIYYYVNLFYNKISMEEEYEKNVYKIAGTETCIAFRVGRVCTAKIFQSLCVKYKGGNN